jgi:apolipoprotein D and lipocalin family protein
MLGGGGNEPIETVAEVDLDRFMGKWYVISHIPTFIEDEAYNAIETYERGKRNRIETTFTFNNGAFDGPFKKHTPVGFVRPDTGNAVWGMQFIWPIKAEYRIIWLNDDYTITVIGRTARDFVWVMAREPSIDDDTASAIRTFLAEQGYDINEIREVPQRWPGTAD